MRSTTLPLGDINVVVVTDDHSWVAGHGRHEPALDADYGDVLSFYQGLRKAADRVGKDVFFVMNGDFMDGTGLSTIPPDHLLPILEQMPFDAINIGNHELYHNETVEYMRDSGFIDHWKGNYLTTNTLWEESHDFIGRPYTYLYGKHSHTKILTFGFLYNFENNCKNTMVLKVQDTVKMKWFRQVLLRRDYDAVLVLAHMDAIDPLTGYIHKSIRSLIGPEMPIQFINGHTHRRAFHFYDDACTAFEAGRFLDTIGFVSFPTFASARDSDVPPRMLFRHVFLDANEKTLQHATGVYNKTEKGSSLTDLIHQTQNSLGIEDVLGCSAHSYMIDRPLNAPDSLYGLYMRQVFPFEFGYNFSKVFVQSTGALRYSLLQGEVSIDDLIAVSPFEDLIFLAAQQIKGSDILATFDDWMNTNRIPREWPFPYIFSGAGIDPQHIYDVYAADFDTMDIRRRLEQVIGRELAPATMFGHNDGSVITTKTVWQRFVVSNWPCSEATPLRRLDDHGISHSLLSMSLTAMSAIGVLLLLLFVSRPASSRQSPQYAHLENESRDYGSMEQNDREESFGRNLEKREKY